VKALLRIAIVITLVAAPVLAAPPTVNDLLRYVPADAQVVMALDTAALRAHPLTQAWILEHQAGWTGVDSDLQRFLSDAGLDPLRDVDLMVVAASTTQGGGHALALFAGRYDPSSLGAAVVARGGRTETVNGVALYLAAKGKADDAALALPSAELVIAGDESAVRAALATRVAGRTLVGTAVAAGQIDLRAPFWLVALVPDEMRQGAGTAATRVQGEHADTVRSVLAAGGTVQCVAMQARLDRELTLTGVATTDTAENAELVRDAVKGALAAARLQLGEEEPELVEVLRDTQVQVKGTEVNGKMVIPLPLIEKLARKAHHGDGPTEI
jgi:hypothetical protein